MMASDFIIDVSEADFEYQVVAYSQETPVVVDFWAPWCGPCRSVGPVLERLAKEANGSFRLAKVNIDDNPKLAQQYNIRSIPAVKAFREGRIVSEFIGALPEPRLREFVRKLAPSAANLLLEKATSLLQEGQYRQAEEIFNQALEAEPDQPGGMLGLARALLFQGKGQEALAILKRFPASREYTIAENLRPLAQALASYNAQISNLDEDPLDAAYHNTLRLIMRGNVPAAMDGLLDILRQDKHYRNGQARKTLVGLLDLLGDEHPLTNQYRNEMASIIF